VVVAHCGVFRKGQIIQDHLLNISIVFKFLNNVCTVYQELKRCCHFNCGRAEQMLSTIIHFSASTNNTINISFFLVNTASLSGAKEIFFFSSVVSAFLAQFYNSM
jgi:hypothetical protein